MKRVQAWRLKDFEVQSDCNTSSWAMVWWRMNNLDRVQISEAIARDECTVSLEMNVAAREADASTHMRD
jgi:hypothetical protein